MQAYVVGFMFSAHLDRVALIHKLKPEWQLGLMNGVGGKTEPGEQPIDAMVREFKEEVDVPTLPSEWSHFCTLIGSGFKVECFAMADQSHMKFAQLKSNTTENYVIVPVDNFHPRWTAVIPSVNWLVPLAIDHLKQNRTTGESPRFSTIEYP